MNPEQRLNLRLTILINAIQSKQEFTIEKLKEYEGFVLGSNLVHATGFSVVQGAPTA